MEGRAREHNDNDSVDEEEPGAGVGVSRIFRTERESQIVRRDPYESMQLSQMHDVESTVSKTQE